MKIIKESIKLLKNNSNLLLITGLIFSFIFFLTQKPNKTQINNPFRNIEENTQSENLDLINFPLLYHFIQNITKNYYFGEWEYLKIKDNIFKHKNGSSQIKFMKNKTLNQNYISGLETNNSTLSIFFFLKDGRYLDYFIRGNISFYLPERFSKQLNESITKRKNITFILKNTNLSYYFGEYFEDHEMIHLNNTEINFTIIQRERYFYNNQNYEKESSLFSRVIFSIRNKKENFETKFYGIMYGGGSYSGSTLNYSILLTLISLIEIYYSTFFITEISENNQIALNLDLITIIIQIMWGSLICASNFFLAITHESSSYEYGMPSITYFSLFSVFQLRILFLAWKSRYNDLMYENVVLFRKKLFKFYSIFYAVLFISLISIKFIFEYYFLTFILFFITWIFQIYYSIKTSTKPPQPFSYIFLFTFSKMFAPIYIKAYPYNIFQLEPSYKKVFFICITLFIESIIISLQKILGPKFFIPKFLKGKQYNYYKNYNEINENDLESICPICLVKIKDDPTKESDIKLELVSGDSINNINNVIEEEEKKISIGEKIIKIIESWKKNLNKKPLMVTPCHHIYHTICLEKCLESRNLCPCCRTQIPSIDDL